MVTIKYYQSKDRDAVLVRFTYLKTQIRMSTGVSVKVRYWNKVKELPYPNYPKYIQVRDHLSSLSDFIIEQTSKGVSMNKLKSGIRGFSDVQNKSLPNFLQVSESLIDYKKKMGIETKYFKTLHNKIIKYQEENGITLELNDIDETFKDSFIIWCREKEYATNTVQRFLKRIREVKIFAITNKIIQDDGFIDNKWKAKKFVTDSFVLTPKEIEDLINHIPPKEYLRHTKARFLCTYYTGVRISDFKRLKDFKIIEFEGDSFISFRTFKGDAPVVLPLFDELKLILDEYNGFPPAISDQKQNEYLKELFQPLLDYDIRIRKSIAYKLKTITAKAYSQVTNHTSRRCFATHLYIKGIPLSTIQLILGHTQPTQTIEYIKLDSMQKRMTSKELLRILKNSMTR